MYNAKPLVSVIVPFFNEARFLEETVQSVLAQTYPHWELILIDDGSTDGSTEMAKDFMAENSDKIRYVAHAGHANKGLSATRNAGIATATGTLVALLDADDVWLPERLENGVAVFEQNTGVALLCEPSLYWYSWQNPALEDVLIEVGAPGNKAYEPPALALQLYPLGTGAAPCPSGLMIRTEVLRRMGGFEASFTGPNQMYEDQPFLAKFYLGQTVYITTKCCNKYRQRHGSLVQKVKAEGRYDAVRLYFLNWLQQYLQQNNITHPTVQAALQRALRPYRYRALYKFTRFLKRKLAPAQHG